MSTAASSRVWKRSTVVLVAVLLSLAAFGATTQTWLSIQLPQTAVKTPPIDVPGSDAATAVTAFALVGLAAALAISIAGRILGWVITVVLFVAGIGIAWSSAAIMSEPATAAQVAIGKAIGVTDSSAASISVTPFPLVALIAGSLLSVTAVWAAVAGRRWAASRRYSAQAGGGPESQLSRDPHESGARDDIDSWDQLSHGQDPTR